nr:hypothetical protein [Bacteroidota bacterium]
MNRYKKINHVVFFILIVILPSSCGFLPSPMPPINDALTQVNQAIENLDNNSASWQQILTDLKDQIDVTFKQDVTTIIDRAIMSTGEQANCLIDIRVQQIRKALLALRARITGEEPQLLNR